MHPWRGEVRKGSINVWCLMNKKNTNLANELQNFVAKINEDATVLADEYKRRIEVLNEAIYIIRTCPGRDYIIPVEEPAKEELTRKGSRRRRVAPDTSKPKEVGHKRVRGYGHRQIEVLKKLQVKGPQRLVDLSPNDSKEKARISQVLVGMKKKRHVRIDDKFWSITGEGTEALGEFETNHGEVLIGKQS